MFLIETVHARYPHLVNWVDAFAELSQLRVDENEIRAQADAMSKRLASITRELTESSDDAEAESLVSPVHRRPKDDFSASPNTTKALLETKTDEKESIGVVNATTEALRAFDDELMDLEAKCNELPIHFGFRDTFTLFKNANSRTDARNASNKKRHVSKWFVDTNAVYDVAMGNDFWAIRGVLAKVGAEWQRTEQMIERPLLRVYHHIVRAYWRSARLPDGRALPGGTEALIYAMLSVEFKFELMSMYDM